MRIVRAPIIALAISGISIAAFVVQYASHTVFLYMVLNPDAIAGSPRFLYMLLTYALTNASVVQLALNIVWLLLSAFVVEAMTRRWITLTGAAASAVLGGIAFLLYARLTSTEAVYVGTATVASGYVGMMLVLGLRPWFLSGWNGVQKVIYCLLTALVVAQIVLDAIIGHARWIPLTAALIAGSLVQLIGSRIAARPSAEADRAVAQAAK